MNEHVTPPPAIGDNSMAGIDARLRETHAQLAQHCADLVARAGTLPAIESDTAIATVAEYVKLASAAMKRAEALRVDEKAPYLEAERKVDGFFASLSKPLKAIKDRLERDAGAYQRAKEAAERRKREDEARAAREKAEADAREARRLEDERRQHEAEAARDRANEAAIEARVAQRAAEVKPAELTRVRAETGAMATARAVWDFEIIDARALDLDALRPHVPRAALEQAMRSYVNAGGREIEGARIFEITKAVFR